MMADVAAQFPAKTEGHGGDRLDPKVLADGTKEFDLDAKIVKWEVSPGKLVDLADTIKGFKGLVEGKYDHLPEAAFYMVGTIEEAIDKGKKLAAEAA